MTMPDDETLNAMADAMIDPYVRISIGANQNFRKERIRVLTRAIAAAEQFGWHFVKVEPNATDSPRPSDHC